MSINSDKYFTTSFEYQEADQLENVAIKQALIDTMQNMLSVPQSDLDQLIRTAYDPGAVVRVTHPINELGSLDDIRKRLWEPLRNALPDIERRKDIVAAGRYRGASWIGCIGHYVGTFENDLLDIPATRGVVSIRFTEGHEIRDGKIVQSVVFVDFLDLMRQAGYWPLPPSLGREMRWLPPSTRDGVILDPQDHSVSRRSIERILRMHAALGRFSGDQPTRPALDHMEMVKHWHPNFMWYGPAGIGTTRGLRGFEDYHQIPFLLAFSDRSGSEVGHFIRIGDGNYGVTGGWGYLQATHLGSGFLGLPPTGKRLRMRVMDFYRCDEETIVENWVLIDIPHLLLQLGIDVFGRMRHQFRQQGSLSTNDWLVS